VLLAAVILIAFVAAVWQLRPRQNFKAFVAREVKAGVPAGTTRSAAEAWCVRTFRFIPMYRSPEEIAEWKTWLGKKAGVPAAVPGGVIEGTAPPREPLSRAYDLIRPQHVWYYLLLDERGKVYDYRFMSFNELREIERWR
jgi:hypothetical protein